MAERTEHIDRIRVLEEHARAQRELTLFMRRLGVVLGALAFLTLAGTLAFSLAEHVSLPFGFVWTLDTITTLGSIPDPKDAGGRAIIVALELFGIGTLFYGLATVAEFFVSGQLSGVLDERRKQRMIDSYSEHFIICGYGRVGRQVAKDLRRGGVNFLVIDHNPDNREAARSADVVYVERDASEDETLREAGIMRAAGIIACVDSDAENIFITLTARELRSDIVIIARASAEDSEKKLLRAGADRVISPYKTSGSEMARIALHPQVGGAVDVADFRLEEIEVSPLCEGVGKTIEEVRGRSTIVALRRADGRLEPQPTSAAVIEAGDKLVALGTPETLQGLEDFFQPTTPATA